MPKEDIERLLNERHKMLKRIKKLLDETKEMTNEMEKILNKLCGEGNK